MTLRQKRGLSVTTTNILTRAVSSYLSWLHNEGRHHERLRIKQLPNPPKPIKVFSDADVRRIVTFRPKGRNQPRTWTLLVLMLDTGLRLSEALTLERQHVDLDGRAIKVLGKGHRERWVPISGECRKHLHRLLARTEGALVFKTASGSGITRHNAHRDIKRVCRAISKLTGQRLPKGGSALPFHVAVGALGRTQTKGVTRREQQRCWSHSPEQ